jgi:hypothetical protein
MEDMVCKDRLGRESCRSRTNIEEGRKGMRFKRRRKKSEKSGVGREWN